MVSPPPARAILLSDGCALNNLCSSHLRVHLRPLYCPDHSNGTCSHRLYYLTLNHCVQKVASPVCYRPISVSQLEAFLFPFLPLRWETQSLPLSLTYCSHGQGREDSLSVPELHRSLTLVTQVLSDVSLKSLCFLTVWLG